MIVLILCLICWNQLNDGMVILGSNVAGKYFIFLWLKNNHISNQQPALCRLYPLSVFVLPLLAYILFQYDSGNHWGKMLGSSVLVIESFILANQR